jgi:uncharacterized membrane protein YkoI
MRDKLKGVVMALGAVAVLAVGGTAIAGAASGGDDDGGTDKAITGQALDRAEKAALDATGGGKVTSTEIDDEEGAYEVEVTRAGGSQVDVHLDKSFHVLGKSTDGEHGENDAGDRD